MKIFLDLDNTVTESRGKIAPEMVEALSNYTTVVIVSGASEEQMRKQLGQTPAILLSQNGNVNDLWRRELTHTERVLILNHIASYNGVDSNVEDRGAQISYSFTGHSAPVEIKKAYDPDGSKRRAILTSYPLVESLEAKIGGTTCIDYFPAGLNKGYNVGKYIQQMGWRRSECIYVGDALFPGGNDESVIGVIATFPVNGWKDTLRFLTS